MFEQDTTDTSGERKIGLLAGGGQFPLLFAHAARQAGVYVVAVGFEGETDPMLGKYAAEFHLLKLGRLNRLIKTFKNAGVQRAAMAGTINKTRLYARIRPDWRAVKFLGKLKHKKDDFLLRALAEELELEGIRIEPSTMFLPDLLAPEGILTRRKPNRKEQVDIEFGWSLAKKFGDLDIGQCLVVRDRAVLAVEGIDGTDATILRGGRLCREGAIVIKVSKPNQDLRFDVPAVGYDTIEAMKRVKARVLVAEAEKTLIFDREKMIDAANAAGITIWVRKDDALSQGDERSENAAPAPLELRPAPSSVSDVGAFSGLFRKAGKDAVRVGVVGVGYLGRFHAQKYARLPEADLIAIVDVDDGRLAKVGAEIQADRLKEYRELFGRVDAVSIVTPTSYHHSIAREFLSRGIHVLLEKPMTRTLVEADELISLAEKNHCVLQVGHLERFNSALQAAYPRIRNPMFLEAHRLAMFNERGLEVDVILDLMIHDIDIVLSLIDAPLENIRAAGVSVLTPLPDIATVRMEFTNGAVANLTASRISIKNLRKLRIFQEDCYLSADYANKRSYVVYKENPADEAGYPEISIEELEIEETDALEEEIISFLKAVRQGEPVPVDGRQGRRALAVALEISAQIDKQISLKKAGT
jgi:hypothetical protein